MLAAAVLLTTSWLLGPPPEGQFEIYVGGTYAEAPQSRFDQRFGWQETRINAGFSHNIDGQHTFRVNLPYVAAQNDFNGEVFFENRGVGRAVFSAERWVTPALQFGLGVGIPMGQSQRSVQEQFPESGDAFPALNDGSTRGLLFLSHLAVQKPWSLAGRVRLEASLDDGSLFPGATAIALYELIPDALRTGFIVRGDLGIEDDAPREVSIGLFERIGPSRGLAGELEISTHVHADNVEAATEARLTVIWRQ